MIPVLGQCPGHVAAEIALADGRRVEVGDDPATKHHEQPVGQTDQLLEVGGDEQRGEAGSSGIAQDVPDHRLRADVDAAGGMGGDEHGRLGEHLPPDDQLLLIAARQREGTHVDARRAHVEAATTSSARLRQASRSISPWSVNSELAW